MANNRSKTLSQDEVLNNVARLVAGTINPTAMELTVDQVDVENFIKYFKEIGAELLSNKENLHLVISPSGNTDDIQIILDYIEEKMQTKFHFYYEMHIGISKNECYAHWMPH